MTYHQDINPPRRNWTGTLTISGTAEEFGALVSAITHVLDEMLYELTPDERQAFARLQEEARDVITDIQEYSSYDTDQ